MQIIQPKEEKKTKCGESLTVNIIQKLFINLHLGFQRLSWYVLSTATDADFTQDKAQGAVLPWQVHNYDPDS